MRILGIDPGSLVTGYGVVESPASGGGGGGGGLLYVCHGVVMLKGHKEISERLLALSEGLDSVVRETGPDAVAVESVFHSKNARSALILGHARGVALLVAARYGLPVYEYPPTTVKQAVTGYGHATKDQVQRMTGTLLGRPSSAPAFPRDAADALAVAICHINHSGGTGSALRAAGALGAAGPKTGAG